MLRDDCLGSLKTKVRIATTVGLIAVAGLASPAFGQSFVGEWTATATHAKPIARNGRTLPPTGKTVSWNGMDIMPVRDGLVARKDVYVDSVTYLKQIGVDVP